MHRVALVQLAILATSVHAFFPYIPTYACSQYHGCGDQDKRAVPEEDPVVRDTDPGELLTFKLAQRFSPGNRDPSAVAARQAGRLRRKYGSGEEASPTPLKRENTFTIDHAATPTTANSVGIDQDGADISYFVQANIGSTGAALYLLCDTGAGTTWVMGNDCNSTACGEHTTWNPSDSTTQQETGKDFSILYGTGSVAGSLVTDSITIGSVAVNMVLGVANTTSDDFTHFAFDGILGLSLAASSTDNFINSIKSDKALSSNIFSVDLNRNSDGNNTGELTFGGTDPAKYTGAITYTSVNSSAGGDWAIPLDDMAYSGTKAGVTGKLAYIDTGTSYAFGPSADVVALHKLIPGANSTDGVTFTAPCDSSQSIVLTFSGVDFPISSKDWLSSPDSSGTCTSNIYGREAVSGAFLFGDVFLKNVYTVFDADASRIGFASKPVVSTSTSSSATGTTGAATMTGSSTAVAESSGATTTLPIVASGGRSILKNYPSVLCAIALVLAIAY